MLIWDFWVLFENYSMRMLSIRGNDFIAHWAYDTTILSHTEHTRNKFSRMLNQFLHVNLCWAYAERIPHTEHTRNEFYRWLSIRGMDFIAGWVYTEMFKSRISRPNRIRFSKISCYRPLGGTIRFRFLQKNSKKKFQACVPLSLASWNYVERSVINQCSL